MDHNPRELCPPFDPHNYQPILDWAKASVQPWDTKTTSLWALQWKYGTVTIGADGRNRGHCAVALFIYLFTRNVDVLVARHCAEAYVKYLPV